jgi:hypothetical protein
MPNFIGSRYPGLAHMARTPTRDTEAWTAIGPSKTVTSEEQFIPLFTCVPRLDRVPHNVYGDATSGIRRYMWSNTAKYLESLSTPVACALLAEFQRLTQSELSYESVEYLSTCPNAVHSHYYDLASVYENKALWDGLNSRFFSFWTPTRWKRIQDDLMIAIPRIYPHSCANVAKYLTLCLPPAARKRAAHWRYGLIKAEAPLLLTEHVFEDVVSSPTQRLIPTMDFCNDTLFYTRWFYFAEILPVEEYMPIDFLPGISAENLRQGSNYALFPSRSVLDGVQSHFCVMVKAKHFEKLTFAVWVGQDLEELEIPRGDFELWEDVRFSQLLDSHKNAKKIYSQEVRALVRNQLKCPVRTFPNLTEALFDVKKINVNSPTKHREEATRVLKNTKALVDMFLGSQYHGTPPDYTHLLL